MTSRGGVRMALAALLTVVLAGCSGAAPDDGPGGSAADSDDPRVAASKDEDRLLVYGAPPASTWQAVLPAFNKKYPWIKVETVDIQGQELVQRLRSEESAGVQSADMVVDFADTWLKLAEKNDVRRFDSAVADELPEQASLAPGVYAMEFAPLMVMYNTKLLSKDQVPTTWAGFLELAKKQPGKVASYDITVSPQYATTMSFIESDPKAWDTLDELLPRLKVEASGGTLITKTGQGEYVMSFALPGNARALADELGVGELLGFVLPTDYVSALPRGVGVTKKGNSPNSAELLIDFLLSADGQRLLCKDAGMTVSHPAVADDCGQYSTKTLFAKVGQDNVYLERYDRSYVKGREDLIKRWHKAMDR